MHFRTLSASFAAVLLVVLLTAGCTALEPLASPFSPPTPRERYALNLEAVELDVTTLGQAWLRAGDEAVSSPVDAEAPLREVLYFDPARPEAAGFRMTLREGQRLEIRLRALQEAPLPFVELLQPPAVAGEEPEMLELEALDLQPAVRVAESAGAPGEGASLQGQRATWRHEPGEDGAVILRLQPELLSGGAFELEARVLG
ncbi:MAG: hypothetical protein SX243_13415, partial [Acidobacteriota bacterium]|nr:hypothetical protein [Acidobacteriota bacterium]